MEPGGDAEAEPALAASARDWSELPLDALASVFAKLGAVDILMGAAFVCHSWLDAAKVPYLWRRLDMASHNSVVEEKCRSGNRFTLCAMAMEAVDRSSGQLEVFIGDGFVDDYLLKYIGARAPSLKILHLTFCSYIPPNEGFVAEAINKFPLLEELKFFAYHNGAYCSDDGFVCPIVRALTKAPSLKILHFTVCSDNLNEGFVEAINKFPQLEELKLFACDKRGRRATYEAVGKACQNLKHMEIVENFSWESNIWSDQDDFYWRGDAYYDFDSDFEEDNFHCRAL